MEVKSTGAITVNELFTQVQQERSQTQKTQGSVDTSSRQAEAVSRSESHEWNEELLSEKLDALNHLVQSQAPQFKSFQFEKHDKLERMMIRVIDQETEEVIKEIPPKEFLDMISSMLEFAGIIIDEKI
ncbi:MULTISPECIES: flagellar protein FlaG [Bacillaceae]|uniref:Flagellar protein FlaG n=1 Tax=Evansella alkalicola TaxID=745819 RepID=A0ABS6JV38_9BACI|nr:MULTISPECIES: flagellar protein FlaG [Bacillaceae]MBU9722275.1 flagellar protein FlaG [Bacillus alkalicola]